MKKSELRQLIKEEIKKTMLVDRIYNALSEIDEFKQLGMDQQGELVTQIEDLFAEYNLNENEFDAAIEKFKGKVGLKPTTAKNVMRNSPESLPGYRELPDTRADVTDFKKGIKIPSVNAGSVSTLFSKEEVKKWFEEFKTRYKESPQFKIEGTTIEVTNPKYQEALATYAQAVKQFGTKGD